MLVLDDGPVLRGRLFLQLEEPMSLSVPSDTCERYHAVLDAQNHCTPDVLVVEGATSALSLLLGAAGQAARRCLIIHIQQRPICVVLDLDAQGNAGLEVCRTIRAAPETTDTLILLLTAQRSIEAFDAALLAGADEILLKPLPNAALLARVEASLQTNMHSCMELRMRCQRLREQRAVLEAERARLA